MIEGGGIDPARTKKVRDVARSGKTALVIDDIAGVKGLGVARSARDVVQP